MAQVVGPPAPPPAIVGVPGAVPPPVPLAGAVRRGAGLIKYIWGPWQVAEIRTNNVRVGQQPEMSEFVIAVLWKGEQLRECL